jgi:hypothetical protein
MEQVPSRPSKMRLHLIAIPVLLTIHNIEEVVGGMGATREVIRARLPEFLGSLAGSQSAWLVAVVAVTVIPWLLLLLGGLDRRDSGVARVLVVLQAGMSLTVLSHVGGTIVTGAYTGGVATAVLLYVPFSLRFFPLAWREEWVNRRVLRWSPVLALLLVPLLLVLLALGSAIAG